MDKYRKMQCVKGLLVSLDEQLARYDVLNKGVDSEDKIIDHYFDAIKEKLKQSEDIEKKEFIIALHKQGVISENQKMELLNKVEENSNFKTIIVNGKKHNIIYNKLSYHKILELAFGVKYPNRNYTMTFSYRNEDASASGRGSVTPDQIITIIDGMIFNVADTSKT